MRAFVSIDVEDSQIVQGIQDIQAKIAQPGIRLVNPSIIHLTIKFLGEIPPEKGQQIATILTEIVTDFPPFEISFIGFGVFPNLRRPRVVWIGVQEEDNKDHLKGLAAAVDRGLHAIGFPAEKRPFSSHLTIGRVKFAKPPLHKQLRDLSEEWADESVGKMVVNEIRLKSSTLTPKGPIYETVATATLTSAGTP
ncbi:MAG: RNA 2',3'-cyclic phosphodiesterase [Candidatus Heimdallarchaeota archaeon]